jgi:hypothetical protein
LNSTPCGPRWLRGTSQTQTAAFSPTWRGGPNLNATDGFSPCVSLFVPEVSRKLGVIEANDLPVVRDPEYEDPALRVGERSDHLSLVLGPLKVGLEVVPIVLWDAG